MNIFCPEKKSKHAQFFLSGNVPGSQISPENTVPEILILSRRAVTLASNKGWARMERRWDGIETSSF